MHNKSFFYFVCLTAEFSNTFRYFWKLVVNPAANTGIVFIGLNDPFMEWANINPLTDPTYANLRTLCTNPFYSELLGTIDYNKHNIFRKGFMYACEVQDVTFDELPISKNVAGKIEIESLGTETYIEIKGKL